jgi:hypothetical protein
MTDAVGGGRDTSQACTDDSDLRPAKLRSRWWRSWREQEVEQALYQIVDEYERPVAKLLGV